jgi:mono/diheme cytochrome c family protein
MEDLRPVIRTSILVALLAVPAMAQSNGEKPATSGTYTEEQAALGETVFRGTCSACHVPSDLSGEQFKLNWVGKTVFEYFKILKKTMPDDNPGGLSDGEYTRVVAYILKLNGYPAGADSLSSDSTKLNLIKLVPPATDPSKPPKTRR